MDPGEDQLSMADARRHPVLLLTGTTGIAAATAELAAVAGARVFVIGLTAEAGATLQSQLETKGAECGFCPADLTRPRAVNRAVRQCVQRFGRIDGLFNVVGISGRKFGDGPVHECTDEGWRVTLNTNLNSMFYVSRTVLQQMLAQPPGPDGSRGAIVNLSSVLAFSPAPRYFATHAYATSKAALLGLTRTMAAYYAPYGIRVNALAPALVRTPMSRRAQEDPRVRRFLKTKQPLAPHLIPADAVARAALFLLSQEAAMITGDTLTVDAGWCASEG